METAATAANGLTRFFVLDTYRKDVSMGSLVKKFGINEDEAVLSSYHASLRDDGKHLVHGTLYVFMNHICFSGKDYISGDETNLSIPVRSINSITKGFTARVVPNVIKLDVRKENGGSQKHTFGSLLNRHETYKVIETVWKRKQLAIESEVTSTAAQDSQRARVAMEKLSQNFEVIKPLGKGGYGEAFLVMSKRDFRQYVVKKINVDGTDQSMYEAKKEVALLQLLRHPFVVGYHEFFTDQTDGMFLVMEYCVGGELGKHIDAVYAGKGVPEKQLLLWLAELCFALDHLHANFVIHRDIKLANLFLTRWNDIKLGDFGLATCRSERKKSAGLAVGTWGYAAPELIKKKPYDEKADMYSVGSVIYELMTMRSAYDDYKAGVFPMPVPATYSKELRDMMNQLLSESPADRPSAQQVIDMPFLARAVAKAQRQGEVYGQLTQHLDEMEQLRLKIDLLEQRLREHEPELGALRSRDGNVVMVSSGEWKRLLTHFGADANSEMVIVKNVNDGEEETSLAVVDGRKEKEKGVVYESLQ